MIKNSIANVLEKLSKTLRYGICSNCDSLNDCDFSAYCNKKKKWVGKRIKSCSQYNHA